MHRRASGERGLPSAIEALEATDFETFAAKNEGDGSSEAVLVSLSRDLGADRADPVLAIVAKPARDLASAG
jgi:hypothetical protein